MEDSSIRVLLVKKKALEIIYTFPVSKNGNHFLRIKDGRKLFFSIFIKKYGLDGSKTNYLGSDVMRRVRVVEFFDYMVKDNEINRQERGNHIIETKFYRLIIAVVGKPGKQRLEMLSFYHYL